MRRRTFSEWAEDSAVILGIVVLGLGFGIVSFLPIFI